MIPALSASVSAIRAQSVRMDISANDVANYDTPDYAQSRAIFAEQKPGTRIADIQKIASPAPGYSATDYAEEAVEQIDTSASFQANLRTISVQDSMTGDLLDILA